MLSPAGSTRQEGTVCSREESSPGTTMWHLDLRITASDREKINVCCLRCLGCGICCGSPSAEADLVLRGGGRDDKPLPMWTRLQSR